MTQRIIILLVLASCLLSSCSENCVNTYESNSFVVKRIKINYTQYGNFKTITYFQDNKPRIDSAFYFDDNYPEIYQSKKQWFYNEDGLVDKIISTHASGGTEILKEISYDDQLRISFINYNNNYHSFFMYDNLQITKNHISQLDNSSYTYHYVLDENHHIISETNPNGIQTATAQYANEDMIEFGDTQVSNYNFDYLDFRTIPLFMKHPEFGEDPINYVLFQGGLHISTLLNIGTKFINEVTNDNGIVWSDLRYIYEFNDNSLPVHILKGDTNGYVYVESFFEYE